jgi:molybdopterin-biosynthesis enzyme MoeA-like protein
MKRKVIFIATILLLSACSSESKNGTYQSSVAANSATEAELKASLQEIEAEEQARLKEEMATNTTMEFESLTHDFGKILEDSENRASYVVKNTGKNPLIIDKVEVSCGCTTASKPEKPILPGKTDKIEIIFHPKVGQLNQQEKTVTVTANTEPKTALLVLKANVQKKS